MKKIISTNLAPSAIGTYSQAVSYSNLLFISGQIGINVENNSLESGFESQARQVFQNILNIIKAKDASLDLSSVLKLTIYLKDLSDFNMLNEIMYSLFDDAYPSRAAVEVSRLPKDALIEIDAIVASQ
jgi:2-iminobutanoate/2-iminopropanoate deaminase